MRCKRAQTGVFLAATGAVRGDGAEWGRVQLLVRWAFHLCEPCDVGICVKKKEYQLVVLLKREN